MPLSITKGRKRAAIGAVAAVLLGATAAFAFFTTTGSGVGSAQTGSATSVSITQIGAGYDSLVTTSDPNSNYIQDQCFDCAAISQFGNDITLKNPAPLQRLITAVVAFRNWGAPVSQLPITLSIAGGPSATVLQDIPAAQINGRPTTFNVTFPFATHPYVSNEFVYSISFPTDYNPSPPGPVADSLNVALSNSFTQLSVGTDTDPGTVWVQTTAGAGIAGDFPSCTNSPPSTSFQSVSTNCGPSAPGNPGAYGNTVAPNPTVTSNADIPAVEFNVLGGVAAPLYPGAPGQAVDFAITNPGGGSVHVNQITVQIGDGAGNSTTNSNACNTDIAGSNPNWWYKLSPFTSANGLIEQLNNGGSGFTIPPGTTYFSPTGVSIQMIDSGTNQDDCQNASVNLVFSST